MQLPSELAIQLLDIAPCQSAGLSDRVFAEPRHLIHVAQHSAAGRLGQLDRTRIEHAESVQGEALRAKLVVNEGHDRGPDGHQIGLVHAWNEDRKQGSSVGEKHAFLTLEPKQIGVPVLVAMLLLFLNVTAATEKVQGLGSAS